MSKWKKNINWVTGSLSALGKFIVLFPSTFVFMVALFHLLLGTCLRGWLQPACSVQTLFHPQLCSCLLCLLLGPDFKSGLQRPISAPTAFLTVVVLKTSLPPWHPFEAPAQSLVQIQLNVCGPSLCLVCIPSSKSQQKSKFWLFDKTFRRNYYTASFK